MRRRKRVTKESRGNLEFAAKFIGNWSGVVIAMLCNIFEGHFGFEVNLQ